MILERITAEIGLVERMALEDRTHGAVDDEDAFGEQPVQQEAGFSCFGMELAEDRGLLLEDVLRGSCVPSQGMRARERLHARGCVQNADVPVPHGRNAAP